MTKKSKKKATKFGTRKLDSGGVTSVPLNFSSVTPQSQTSTEQSSSYSIVTINKKKQRKREAINQKEISAKESEENQKRCVYPFDLWCLISKYVAPECIAVFSAVCKDAYFATCTRQFWLTLYRRHAGGHGNLPIRLMPDFVNVKPGLRARVVRALYLTYPIFKNRILPTSSVYGHVDELIFQLCYCFWYRQSYSVKRGAKIWVYYFKFMRRLGRRSEFTSHVKLNSEQNMTLLQVTCSSYMPLPSMTGLVLSTIGISVGRDMKSHQVKMTFHSPKDRNKYLRADGLHLILDPVMDLKVLHWWHPSYPHPLEHCEVLP